MKSTNIDTKEKKTKKERKPFKSHHPLIRISFILSIIALSYSIIFWIIVAITQKPGAIGYFTITAIISTIALIGLIISGVSFRKGRNSYNILGFILNLIIIGCHIGSVIMIVTSGLL